MTSQKSYSRHATARAELRIFNDLPRAIHDALNNCERTPPRASIVLQALLRGVSESQVIETIQRSQKS